MAQQKIIQLGLENAVQTGLRDRLGLDALTDRLNALLRERAGSKPDTAATVSKSSVQRYLASLGEATAPNAHDPDVAAANARVAIDVMANLQGLDERLQKWIVEAEDAKVPVVVGSGDSVSVEYVTDWGARLRTAAEIRKHATAVAQLLERIHNAQSIDTFQRATLDAIREADPATANRVLEALRGLRDQRQLTAAAAA